MKFRNKSLLAAAMAFAGAASMFAGDVTSRTHFAPRTTSSDSALELALSNYNIYHSDYPARPYLKPEGKGTFLMQSTYFYQESDSGNDLARYFLPNTVANCPGEGHANTEIDIKENGLGHVGSQWVGLLTNDKEFDQQLKIRPERMVYGNLWNLHLDFSNQIDGLWSNILIPIVKVKHDVELKCCNRGTAGEAKNCFGDCLLGCEEAFNNREWLHGRISTTTENRSGVDDVQVKIGYDFLRDTNSHWGIYGLVYVPTGHRPQADFLFEPLVGSRHWGLGFGTNADWLVWEIDDEHKFNFMFDLQYRYNFSASQIRSMDLCNGPWTRYATVAHPDRPECDLAGINFFTDSVRVRPRSMVDMWFALHYNYEEWNVELGYDLWWRDREQVRPGKSFDLCCRDIVIYDWAAVDADCPPREHTSASRATIDQASFGRNAAPSDAEVTVLTNSQLDRNSATHGTALSHKFYIAASYNTNFIDHPTSLGFGTSYEYGNNNKALDQWAIYLKTSFGF